MMRKWLYLICLGLVFVLAACTEPAPTSSATETTNSTETPVPAAATQVREADTPTPSIKATSTPGEVSEIIPPVLFCPPHPNVWHAPEDEPCKHHHHGYNPRGETPDGRSFASIFSIDSFDLDEHLDTYGELWQPWLTSPQEDPHGMIWLYDNNYTCEQWENERSAGKFADYDCVTDLLIRIHDVGTADHFLTRFHSETFIVKGCEKLPDGLPNFDRCGIMAHGVQRDYGILETPYKKFQCSTANDPPGVYTIDQPPYRAHPTEFRGKIIQQFWSGQPPNPINAQFYPHHPNALIGFGWSSTDVWQVWDQSICGTESLAAMKELAAQFPPVPGFDHNEFQIFNLGIFDHPAGPYTGWTDSYGNVFPEGEPDGGCTTPSAACIPLVITENFPDGRLILERRVDQGNCEVAPCIVIPTGGVELIFPAYDRP